MCEEATCFEATCVEATCFGAEHLEATCFDATVEECSNQLELMRLVQQQDPDLPRISELMEVIDARLEKLRADQEAVRA